MPQNEPINWKPFDNSGKLILPTGEDLKILDEITSPLTKAEISGDELSLANILFTKCFMPYAKLKWTYGTGNANSYNCEPLSRTLHLTWIWTRYLRTSQGIPLSMNLKGEVVTFDTPHITTNKYKLFSPAYANGNVIDSNGRPTGKCYFAKHVLLKIGIQYFDPTFSRIAASDSDNVERKVNFHNYIGNRHILYTDNWNYLYIPIFEKCDPFTDSWYEITIGEALKSEAKLKYLQKAGITDPIWENIKRKFPKTVFQVRR